MGLNVYFYDANDKEIELPYSLQITHNLTKLADALGYYETIWRADTESGYENGKIPVHLVLDKLIKCLSDLLNSEIEFDEYLPKNGWGTLEGFYVFLTKYAYCCAKYKDAYIYLSR